MAEVELISSAVSFSLEEGRVPSALQVVLVADIRDTLLGSGFSLSSRIRLLRTLTTTSDYIREVNTSEMPCALISYRQELHAPTQMSLRRFGSRRPETLSDSNEFDGLAMDGDALIGVLQAAERLNVKALWCDTWCYRSTGAYNHKEFVDTLHNVMASVVAVVWLPRSKLSSPGEYQYRTTFAGNRTRSLGKACHHAHDCAASAT